MDAEARGEHLGGVGGVGRPELDQEAVHAGEERRLVLVLVLGLRRCGVGGGGEVRGEEAQEAEGGFRGRQEVGEGEADAGRVEEEVAGEEREEAGLVARRAEDVRRGRGGRGQEGGRRRVVGVGSSGGGGGGGGAEALHGMTHRPQHRGGGGGGARSVKCVTVAAARFAYEDFSRLGGGSDGPLAHGPMGLRGLLDKSAPCRATSSPLLAQAFVDRKKKKSKPQRNPRPGRGESAAMAGYRSRSRSYSPQPRRRYSRSPPRYKRYDDPRDRYPRGGGGGGGGGEGPRRGYGRPPAPTGLLVRNISLTARCVAVALFGLLFFFCPFDLGLTAI